MEPSHAKPMWRCSISVRISHPDLDPSEVSEILDSTPQIAQRPGESRVPHGDCRSAGYWCLQHWIDAPDRPDVSLSWAEDYVQRRELQFHNLFTKQFKVDIYVGIFSNVLALGFDLPPMPTISRLGIPVGWSSSPNDPLK